MAASGTAAHRETLLIETLEVDVGVN